jgi:SAM-dependent methyltransferase
MQGNFLRYLAAKKSVDDRSLNHQVWQHLVGFLADWRGPSPLKVLEIGCGIGTMIERLLDARVFPQTLYTALDIRADAIKTARERLAAFAAERGFQVVAGEGGELTLTGPAPPLTVHFEALDLFQLAAREQGRIAADLLIAHGLLDLLDLKTALSKLALLVRPGGRFYFSLNFDGTTLLLPTVDPRLDAAIATLYHRSMDERQVNNKRSGSSRTGGLLFEALPRKGWEILAAGASDWVVIPRQGGYTGDERFFLQCIIRTIYEALRDHSQLSNASLHEWLTQRRRQIAQGKLSYIAHQFDFFGIKK